MVSTVTSTLEDASSISQLQIDQRQLFVQFTKAFKKCKAAEKKEKWKEMFEQLEKALHYLHMAESVYQKIKFQYVQKLQEIAKVQQLLVEKSPEESEEAVHLIDEIMQYLIQVDKEQSVERIKADNMQRWIRGQYSRINGIKKQSHSTIQSYQQFKQRQEQLAQRKAREEQRAAQTHEKRQEAEARKQQRIEHHKMKRQERHLKQNVANDNQNTEGRNVA